MWGNIYACSAYCHNVILARVHTCMHLCKCGCMFVGVRILPRPGNSYLSSVGDMTLGTLFQIPCMQSI